MKEKQNYTKAVTNFIDTILTNSWLKTREPIVTEDSALVLGTREGNIAFKKWMEEVVIPNLKSGNLGAGNRAVLHNKFIDDINPINIDRTATKQPMSVYILPINMMTKSASEQNLLEGYKIDFNNLRYRSYYVKSGDTTYKYPITDLFFYYNLINYKNSVNQNSLTSLYESMNRSGEVILLRDYNKFISEFDSRSDITEGVDYTKDDLLRAVAPIVSEFTANKKQLPYFYSYDEYSMSYILKQRTEEAKNNDEAKKYISTSEEEFVDNIIADMADESLFENDIYDIDGGNIYDIDEGDIYNVDEANLEVEESKSKESKSNYKRVSDVDIQDARFNPDIPLGTLSDLVITKNLASEGNPIRIGTITLTGKMSSENLLPKEIKYKGKTYNTLDLLNVAKNNYKDD